MALSSEAKLLVASMILWLIIVILGFPQAIGIGLAVSRLNGCPLFSDFTNYGPMYGDMQRCNYVTYMPVIISICLGIILFIYHAALVSQAVRHPELGTRTNSTALILLTLLGLILTLIGAGLTSGGLYYFCQSNRVLMQQFFGRPLTCTSGQPGLPGLFRGYDPYYDLQATEVCYWLAVLAWLALFIITVMRSRRAIQDTVDRPGGGSAFRGVTLIPGQKAGKRGEPFPPSGTTTVTIQERTPISQFETKTRHLETAA
ncbi:hypothetical protein RvY_11027 [Ramazzottius varieornatus]|uniref:Uncharacterized protein n=1 Tax=Ramazzottius varieornatus TaxID=947166 RepID=A0A1D1VH71_RAMVA|nr:hypothetical protein RvY_11027 [Ramazzottius varieornatus]